jgi:hypothetical protein
VQRLSPIPVLAGLLLALITFNFPAPLDRSTASAPAEAQDAAQQDLTVRIDPAESVVEVGEPFTVAVMVDNAMGLGGFQFDMVFSPSIVRVDEVTLGGFLGSTGRSVIPLDPVIDNQNGEATFGAFSYGHASGPEGTGALALITLTTQGVGLSALDLQGVLVLDTGGDSQVVIVEDGLVVAGGAPTPTSTPTATNTPTATVTPTPTSITTTTITPEPVVIVSPTSAPVGETFTFTGSHFTPEGLIEEWFTDLEAVRHLLGSFRADSFGEFTRQHNWERFWPPGIYSYVAIDVAKGSETSTNFEMTGPLPQTPTSTPTPTATATGRPTPTATATATPTPSLSHIYLPIIAQSR